MKKERYDRKIERILICKNCLKEFIRKISSATFSNGKIPTLCSNKCKGEFQGKKNKGNNNGMYGKKGWRYGLSKETSTKLKEISEKYSGNNHHNFGTKRTIESKEKTKNSLKKSEKFQEYNKLSFVERYQRKYGDKWELKFNAFVENMQNIFSLEWFKNKYGDEVGIEKYNKRCENIKKTSYFNEYNKKNKKNYSKVSQKLFFEIYEQIKEMFKYVYFAELNHEHSAGTGKMAFDFVIKDNKKIIEYNGEMFHPKEGDINWVSPYKVTYNEQYEKDMFKKNKAESLGYEILYIWHKEYKSNPTEVLKNCLKFINDK